MLILLTGWLITVFFYQEFWKKLVEKEYAFHSKKGWIPPALAKWQRDFALSNKMRIGLIFMWFALAATIYHLAKVTFFD